MEPTYAALKHSRRRHQEWAPLGASLPKVPALPPHGPAPPARRPTYGETDPRPGPAWRLGPERKMEYPPPPVIPLPAQAGCHRLSPALRPGQERGRMDELAAPREEFRLTGKRGNRSTR